MRTSEQQCSTPAIPLATPRSRINASMHASSYRRKATAQWRLVAVVSGLPAEVSLPAVHVTMVFLATHRHAA